MREKNKWRRIGENIYTCEPIRWQYDTDPNVQPDPLCPICGNWLEPDYFAEHVKKFEVVKREREEKL